MSKIYFLPFVVGIIIAFYSPLFDSHKSLQAWVPPSIVPKYLPLFFNNVNTVVMADSFLSFVKSRRTYYPLSKDVSVSKERVEEIVKQAVLHTPSSFNSQSNRAVVLFGAEHDKLWDIVSEVLKPIVPEGQWESTSGRMAMFKAAAGTVLFFEDEEVVDTFKTNIPAYADKFPLWATQSDAMVQFVVWTALEAEGNLGANLQHYNPLIDQRVAAEWKVPATWKLNAQLVFGAKTGEAGDKEFKPVEETVKIFSS